jgi:hypothetical protein
LSLQAQLLNHRGSPWAVKWFLVHELPLPLARPAFPASCSQALVPSSSSGAQQQQRSDGLALERSIMLATSLLSVATSAVMLAKLFSDRR